MVLSAEGLVESQSRSKRVVRAPEQPRPRPQIRLRSPQVLVVGGYAGSGKTELGRILARQTGWPMLDKDKLTRPDLEAALELIGLSPHDRESETYLSSMRPREYEALMAAANENVSCGNSAILAAPFIREFKDTAWLDRTEAAFAALNAQVSVVWVYCDADSMHGYVRHRGAASDGFELNDWDTYLRAIDLDSRPPVPHTVINNCTSSTPLQKQAADFLAGITGGESA
ncbi:AAA family ATPase [Actinoplanes sp. URMC 104]|uniref:AAA family ATPase n=1 Tax=Actinoplanes sp. URMC 104 TaxID=3423409 RepID=UPI003F1D4639